VLPWHNRCLRPYVPKLPSRSRLTHPRLGHNVGLGQHFARPPGPDPARKDPGRRWQSDGRVRSSEDQNWQRPAVSPNPNHFLSFLPLFSLPRAAAAATAAMVAVRAVEGESSAGADPASKHPSSFSSPSPTLY
jgi:hypothetical protein